jgi:hypothetical protein
VIGGLTSLGEAGKQRSDILPGVVYIPLEKYADWNDPIDHGKRCKLKLYFWKGDAETLTAS